MPAALVPPELAAYLARVGPGLVVVAACYVLARAYRDPLPRIAVLVLGFVLLRDAMTPAGLWRIGTAGWAPWLRFTEHAGILLALGAGTLAVTAVVLGLDRDLRALVRRGRFGPAAVAAGAGGAVLAAGPVLLLTWHVPLEERGGAVALGLLPVLLCFCLAGNLAEEVLFRGLLQGRLEQGVEHGGAETGGEEQAAGRLRGRARERAAGGVRGRVRAAALSAVLFAACHAYLASTVTGIGWPLLAFTLLEGAVCAFLRVRHGVLAAALAHGGAIFLLAAGLR